MCISTLETPSKALAFGISLVSVMPTQSPTLARIASGWDGILSARRGSLSCARTNSFPSGSLTVGVRWIVLPIATTLYFRTWRPDGQRPSARRAYGLVAPAAAGWLAVLPRYGVPVWPPPVNGGRSPMFARSSGYAGLPLAGSKRIAGRPAVTCPASTGSRLGWLGHLRTESGKLVGSPGAAR